MTNFKIFAAFFIIAITMVFVTQIFGFLNYSFGDIESNKEKFFCSKSDFDVNLYRGDSKLALELTSFNVNISKLTLVSDEISYIYTMDPRIAKGDSRNMLLNISIEDEYYIYINDCNNTGLTK